jgi:alkanesulfonate monooxygenase SsuD/methylene tetrahydromethanopterin reductase-like flavin-dependent oxidoreductase (luciferase family)
MAHAEDCGFDWVGANEHHFSPYSLMSNCNLIGAALSQRTKGIKLAMLGNLLPLLNPVRVAEEYSMLDVMSGGRLVAGFVRGIPHEYIAYNVAPDESRGRMREALNIILKAWTEPEPFGWEGEYYQYRAISIWPRPRQKPHPRMLMSASNKESAEFVGGFPSMVGLTLIADLDIARGIVDTFKQSARANGRNPGPEDILVGQQTCICQTDEEAHEHMAKALAYFHGVLMRPQQDAQRIVVQKTRFFGENNADAGEYFVKRLQTLKERSIKEQIEAGTILCGSPQSVVKQIRRLRDHLCAGHINMNMKIGTMPDEIVWKSMELFRDKVLPEVSSL